MQPQSLAEDPPKQEQEEEEEEEEDMEISTRSRDTGSAERAGLKRKQLSPQPSSNGHSPQDESLSPIKKKKKPGMANSSKEQLTLRRGPFASMKQPFTKDLLHVVPQDGRNDFYCWVCHREGQVLCCELCPRVYHAKCLKLNAEPEGDWFCPECEKITVAECIETQSKAMTMLTIDQLSYLLKYALQKMKQPGTEPFQKPVSLEQHPDYAEYIFHPMDICTLEKNVKKKMYGCTEAFLADVKWILHNCIIYNGANHKLTATAKVIIKICEHEMNEIEVCPECYLAACQKRDNWFCEPCSNPHPLVWAKLKGFPFWPAKALRDKDGQVDARFFGQHDRAWVPINNCYLMSKEIPFSVKKTKSIFNSAMQEMEVYVENIRKKFGVFNYAPFRSPYTPNNQFQMLKDPQNPAAGTAKPDKYEKMKLNFDMTASPKIVLSKSMLISGPNRRISLTDMPRSPMSTNSSVHTGSDLETEPAEKSMKAVSSHFSASEESMDFIDRNTASPGSVKTSQAGSVSGSPKPFSPQSSTPIAAKSERTLKTPPTGSILNLNLDRSKAEMDLKELSESVLQSAPVLLTSPKKQPVRSSFLLNLDKTIESCKAQLGINEITEDVDGGPEHSDSEDSEKSDTTDSEYASDEGPKLNNGQEEGEEKEGTRSEKDSPFVKKKPKQVMAHDEIKQETNPSSAVGKSETSGQEKANGDPDKELVEKMKSLHQAAKEKLGNKDETDSPTVHLGLDSDSDSENELVIDLGDESKEAVREGKKGEKSKKDQTPTPTLKESPSASNTESKASPTSTVASQPKGEVASSVPSLPNQTPSTSITTTTSVVPTATVPAVPVSNSPVKKQRPLLPKETVPAVQRAVVWNPSTKFQTSSQKWHMQKVQRQQQQVQAPQQQSQTTGTRYQTRLAVKAVQQKEATLATSTSSITLVTSSSSTPVAGSNSAVVNTASSSVYSTDLPIATPSADVAADLTKYTNKMMEAIKGTMTEIYNDLSKNNSGSTIAEIRRMKIEIDKLQWLHQQELAEMKHNLELTMAEMRQSLEQEKDRMITEMKKQMEAEKQQAVDETKKKQWCANCRKEAIFYCCWNTSYCDYPCQQAHWPEHMKSCTQSATATQQETESEVNSDALNKNAQQAPTVQQSPSESKASQNDKDTGTDKSKENTMPAVVTPAVGAAAVQSEVQCAQTTMPVQTRRT
ncbi:MYND-type zinc finger-containing chromatin reader ZMYND8 isoform X1 [Hemiscyllium ocellatum]|uniref:MYND-type zinc finger-containing chromatin reader ZMYND8 isoform X1 n=2 Tax=Hemiscyllium ocellatum TaxID=170820 RepID=UPI00296624E9|nr:MYND-type zinc finger-containing chromatin reader ZMYND8 isoform X1 [Hemiscyllium ocellatum]